MSEHKNQETVDENIEDLEKEDSSSLETEEASSFEPETEEVEEEKVLSYPERVPNSKRGVSYSHSYVMIGLVVVIIVFSLVISNFTLSY